MPTTRTAAPVLDAAQVSAVLAAPAGVAVLDLVTGAITVHTDPTNEVWESPRLLVLITQVDVLAAAALAARTAGVLGGRPFLATLVDVLNGDLADLAAAGEIPTEDEVAAVLAELAHFDAEVIELFRAGGAA